MNAGKSIPFLTVSTSWEGKLSQTRSSHNMDNIKALYFKRDLNRRIKKWRNLGITFDELWESYLTEEEYHQEFSEFLNTRVGQIWLKKPEGQTYLKWQHGT